jgi:hypothetical protein
MNGENEGEREWRGWSLLAGERGENSAKTKGGGGGGCRKKRLRFLGLGIFFFFFVVKNAPLLS